MNCLIINGPNLNLLGKREKGIYGEEGFDSYLHALKKRFSSLKIDYFQSNVEGEIINTLHNAVGKYQGVLLNAGGYTHTSVAIADAIAAIDVPVVEIHISNIMNRESYRNKSLLSAKCVGVITGFGLKSYDLGLYYLINS